MPPTVKSVAQKWGTALQRAQYAGWTPVLTGRRISTTATTLDGSPDGMTWVRFPDSSYEMTAVFGKVLEADIPYWVGPDINGNFELKKPINKDGVEKWGDLLYTVAQPPSSDATPQTVGGLGFVPGRLELSRLGGLYVHPRSFQFDGGYYDDGSIGDGIVDADDTTNDFDVTVFRPSVSGYSAWARVYFNPKLFLIWAVRGEEKFGARQDVLNLEDIPHIALPGGVYPLGAVRLDYGQTELEATDLADARFHIAPTFDADTLEDFIATLIEDGTHMTRMTGMGVAGSRRLNRVARALLKRPYTG